MDPRAQTIKAGFDLAHMIFGGVVGDLSQAAIDKTYPGATINAAGAVLAHAILDEDMMLSSMAFGGKTVFETGGFAAKTGIAAPSPQMGPDWAAGKYNLAGLQEYAQAVFANTTKLLESATAAQLEKTIESPLGARSTSDFLAGLAVVHFASHIGEVAALKGIQGLKGLPF